MKKAPVHSARSWHTRPGGPSRDRPPQASRAARAPQHPHTGTDEAMLIEAAAVLGIGLGENATMGCLKTARNVDA